MGAYNPRILEVEAEGSEVQDYPQLYCNSEEFCLKNNVCVYIYVSTGGKIRVEMDHGDDHCHQGHLIKSLPS